MEIYLRMRGGLGNQMLQYGYALEAATASGQLIECVVGLPAVTKIS